MKRSKFNLSYNRHLTCDMGQLIPVGLIEALPGDTFRANTAALIRCSPLMAPIMHPVQVRIHHWFVPYRKIWDDWEDFITGGPEGTSVPTHPYFGLSSITEGSIWDYFGLAPGTYSPDFNVNALPMRAYNLIFNEYYRDQDLVPKLVIDTTDGEDTTSDTDIQKVAWTKDYFTTARPWEQKGDNITIPVDLEGEAAVTGIGTEYSTFPSTNASVRETDGSGTVNYANYRSAADFKVEQDTANTGYPNIRAQLDGLSTEIDIGDLRLALALQRYQEARAQYGSRYVEYLRYLGVRSSDARADRPVYLGGGRQIIQFSEVLQTAEGSGTPVGNMLGHGISALRSGSYQRFFEEHGLVMTLMSVVPKPMYQSATHRMWLREVKEDYFQRELATIGEQEVTYREIQADHSTPDNTFGFQARYDEYRSSPSGVSGEFRSTMDHWHLARQFSGDVALNQSFSDCTPTKRIFASTGTDGLIVGVHNNILARRMIPHRAYTKTF